VEVGKVSARFGQSHLYLWAGSSSAAPGWPLLTGDCWVL
jgi:hypothetical protein